MENKDNQPEIEIDREKDEKNRKLNIKISIILIVLFLIGIIIRWDYITKEIKGSIDRYINPEIEQIDSTKTVK